MFPKSLLALYLLSTLVTGLPKNIHPRDEPYPAIETEDLGPVQGIDLTTGPLEGQGPTPAVAAQAESPGQYMDPETQGAPTEDTQLAPEPEVGVIPLPAPDGQDPACAAVTETATVTSVSTMIQTMTTTEMVTVTFTPTAVPCAGMPDGPAGEVSGVPDIELPEIPEYPEGPEMPEIPELPDITEYPDGPEMPEIPELPEIPETTEGPTGEVHGPMAGAPDGPAPEGPGPEGPGPDLDDDCGILNTPNAPGSTDPTHSYDPGSEVHVQGYTPDTGDEVEAYPAAETATPTPTPTPEISRRSARLNAGVVDKRKVK